MLIGSIKSQAASFLSSGVGKLGSGALSMLGLKRVDSDAAAVPASSSSYTPIQLEATLIYGEATLLVALLNLMEESMLSLLRCGLNIRAGWNLYKAVDRASGGTVMSMHGDSIPALAPGARCIQVPLEGVGGTAATSSSSSCGEDVRGGLQFGAGGFNVVASLLPPVVLRVLSAVGFPNDRGAGLSQLRACFLCGRIRSPLAGILLASIGVLIPSFHTGSQCTPLGEEAKAALEALLVSLPNSALPLWLTGRSLRMRALHKEALTFFRRSGDEAGTYMPQLEQLCKCK